MIPNKLSACFFVALVTIGLSACNQEKAKPKAVSKDITKTTVVVANKKDSVYNNPEKKYGTATVSDPCVKCLLQVIQGSKSFKANTASLSAQDINYTVNWVKATDPALQPDTSDKTNAVLRVGMASGEGRLQLAALEVFILGELPKDMLPALTELMQEPSPEVRRRAGLVLRLEK